MRKIVILAGAVLTQMVVAGGAALASETPLPTIAPAPATASAASSGGGHAFLIFVVIFAIAALIVAGALAVRRFGQESES